MPDKQVASIPDLSSINDPATRAILEPLVAGWRIRNGESPKNDDHAFITKADIDSMVASGKLLTGVYNPSANGSVGGRIVPPTNTQQRVTSLVNIVLDAVKVDPFFIFLGERIDKIGPPLEALGKKANEMTTLIRQANEERSNADNAIVHTLNQVFAGLASGIRPVWAMSSTGTDVSVNNFAAFIRDYQQVSANVGSLSAVVQQESVARASADGRLSGQYSVKVDLNGFVSGFGIAADTVGDSEISRFYVRADSFAIGSPVHTHRGTPIAVQDIHGNPVYDADGKQVFRYNPTADDPADVPFRVVTVATVEGGRFVDTGVYMNRAYISNGAIGTAQIGVAEVDTLTIAGQAVTFPVSSKQSSATSAGPGDTTVYNTLSVVIPEASGAPIFVLAVCSVDCPGGSAGFAVFLDIDLDGSGNIAETASSLNSTTLGCSMVAAGVINDGVQGTRVIRFKIHANGGQTVTVAFKQMTLFALETKR